MRRLLTMANTRPHIKLIRTVDVPKNMLTISERRGYHASGKTKGGAASEMVVKIDGREFKHKPKKGDSPATTAAAIKRMLVKGGYKVTGPFPANAAAIKAKRGKISTAQDLLVFKADDSLAVIQRARSNDTAAGGLLGQKIIATRRTNIDAFEVLKDGSAARDVRSVSRNYRTKHFDIYVCGTDTMSGPTACWGVGPTGSYDGWTMAADVGPCSVLCAGAMDAAQKPFNPTHEIFHPLMHVGHTQNWNPIEAAGGKPDRYQIMAGSTSTADKNTNVTKRMADAPIDVMYQVFFRKSDTFFLNLNGQKQDTPIKKFLWMKHTLKDTPVTRFRRIGASYGLVTAPTARKVDGP